MSQLRQWAKGIVPQSLQPPAFVERRLRRLQQDDRVRHGPFKGLRFTWESWDENFTLPLAKFLGTYELELFPVVEKLIRQPFRQIVDVGAAEGYYALGWAMRCPQAHVIAYELLPKGCEVMAKLSQANGLAERVTIRGACTPENLNADLTGGGPTLVMMDVEGYEDVLLDPERVPALREATILFESHDCYVPGVGERICRRFEKTHDIEKIPSQPRRLADLKTISPFLKFYARHSMIGWMNERMFDMCWYCLTPRAPAAAPRPLPPANTD